MTKLGYGIGAVGLVAVVVAVGIYGWRQMAPSPLQAQAPEQAAAAPSASAPSPAEPAVRYPIETPVTAGDAASDTTAAALDPDARALAALTDLLGQPTVLQWVQLDGFARRLVATVDNLAREQAAPRLWPVNPTAGRFSPEPRPQESVIGAGNHARYAAFVALVESVDSARAVAVYRRLYPLFQHAYEDLGYPDRHFNDRLVDVIDHLLATPEPQGPLAVQLIEVKGEILSTRPWVRYEFSDPAHQARSAGQKILLRIGVDNQRRLTAKLAEIRRLVTVPAGRPPGGG